MASHLHFNGPDGAASVRLKSFRRQKQDSPPGGSKMSVLPQIGRKEEGGFTSTREGDGGERYVHCALLGDGMVGKTCLTLSYTQHLFTDHYTATVFDNYPVRLVLSGQHYVVNLLDTAGQTDYESVRAYTYHASEVLLLCFSVCDRESFYNVVQCWLPEIQRHTKGKLPLLLVGTQTDLRSGCRDPVSSEEGGQLASIIGADCYIECSARSRQGLRQVFEHVVFSALKYRRKKRTLFYRLFGR